MRASLTLNKSFMTKNDLLLLNPLDPPGSMFSVGGLYHKMKSDQRKLQMRSLDRD